MTLNKIFLGDNSVVDVSTPETVDEIKLKLASRYERSRLDPKIRFPEEHEDYSTNYVYFVKQSELKIYFSKHLNRKLTHSFQLAYPWFTGNIIDKGHSRVIKGEIGLPEWTFYLTILWFGIFGFIIYISLSNGKTDGIEIPLYFLLFGLHSIFYWTRTDKKES